MSHHRPGCRREWIAVDGPAGAGKSTLARALARALGFRYVDTGAMYRAAALAALRAGLLAHEPIDADAVVRLVKRLDIRIGTEPEGDRPAPVYLDGEDVSEAVRSLEVGQAASAIARLAGVRRILAGLQRRLAEAGPCVMEGRDIGTVILPEACVKLYVTASLEERARRRARELAADVPGAGDPGGSEAGVEAVMRELARRDRQDSSRETAPLMVAPDAVTLDTTGQDLASVLQRALAICRERLGGGP
ncbi:(d)CMP kinase [Geochorda subterranea]|uniref:Cytidylate kinase n=1 Tax=Geochorda subterranea TaxID=3109564 RepID=A0ABZ1BL19_9FIRM|nr:(d)CMP kinase [Limnochorda sp. LNt]WRP13220.1 (d)CMP kinase [Limnochorda sp. LNt]